MSALIIAAESIDDLTKVVDHFEAIRLSLQDRLLDVDPLISCQDSMDELKKAVRDFKWALAEAAAAAARRTDDTQPELARSDDDTPIPSRGS